MSRTLRFILAGAGLIVLIIIAWFVLLGPLSSDLAAVSTSIGEEKTRLAVVQAKLAQAEVTRAEGKKNQARLLELVKILPGSDEVPSLLLQIQALADESGVQFVSITPDEAVESRPVRILPFSVEVSGSFFDVCDFMYRVEQLVEGPGRLLVVKQLDISVAETVGQATDGTILGGQGELSPELNASMILYAFDTGGVPLAAADTSPAVNETTTSTTTSTTTEASGS